MKHRRAVFVLLCASTVWLFAGCMVFPFGSHRSFNTMKYSIENTDKFVLLGRAAQHSVSCTGLQERFLPDGGIEVVANVKNNENRRIQVQIHCVFKNEEGFSTGDETPFQNFTLPEYATKIVRFTSTNPQARRYTIRVRQTR